jgi:hypothetical protein
MIINWVFQLGLNMYWIYKLIVAESFPKKHNCVFKTVIGPSLLNTQYTVIIWNQKSFSHSLVLIKKRIKIFSQNLIHISFVSLEFKIVSFRVYSWNVSFQLPSLLLSHFWFKVDISKPVFGSERKTGSSFKLANPFDEL